jgi:predicted glycoside hydrolase/deacetylase ChbG (UPF0249 family)
VNEAGRRVVLFNADDLGRTIGINEGIVEAHRLGVVRGATLMVGMPAVRDAIERMTRCPNLGVGLHITLSGAEPTLSASQIPSLLGADGRFPAKPEGLAAAKPEEVLAEVRQQLKIFVGLSGRLPTHLDSHHHSHRLPHVLDAVVAVASEHRLPVRRASPAVARRLEAEGIRSSDRFVESFFGEQATLETLLAILRDAVAGTTEVMCHPGHPDEVLRRESTYADEREREIALLTHPDALCAVEELGIELAHFGNAAAFG